MPTLPFCKPKPPLKIPPRVPIPQHVRAVAPLALPSTVRTPIDIQRMWPASFTLANPLFIQHRKEDYMLAFPELGPPNSVDLIVWYYDCLIGAQKRVRELNGEINTLREYINQCSTVQPARPSEQLPLAALTEEGPPDDNPEARDEPIFMMAGRAGIDEAGTKLTTEHEPIEMGPALDHGVQ